MRYRQAKSYSVRAIPPGDQLPLGERAKVARELLGDRFVSGSLSPEDGMPSGWSIRRTRDHAVPNYGRVPYYEWVVLHDSGRVEFIADAEFRTRFKVPEQ